MHHESRARQRARQVEVEVSEAGDVVRVTVRIVGSSGRRPGLAIVRALPERSSVVETVGEVIPFRKAVA